MNTEALNTLVNDMNLNIFHTTLQIENNEY